MSRSKPVVVGAVLFLASCSSGSSSPPPSGPSPYIDGFSPPAVQAGYTRFITPRIDGIVAGTDQQWCQWLSPPSTQDQDISDVMGAQSKWGHHVVLYAAKTVNPVGTTAACDENLMLTSRYLGGVGGEGFTSSNSAQLPAGISFLLPMGYALVANVHVINAGSQTISEQAVIDVKFGAPQPGKPVAQLFTNVGTQFSIPAHSVGYAYDMTCKLGSDISFVAIGNHMHQHGAAITTEVQHADGSHDTLDDNPMWAADWQFNPPLVKYTVDQPLALHAGDVLHTHCVWNGDQSKTVIFPDEMCVMFGFFLSSGTELICFDGQWPSH